MRSYPFVFSPLEKAGVGCRGLGDGVQAFRRSGVQGNTRELTCSVCRAVLMLSLSALCAQALPIQAQNSPYETVSPMRRKIPESRPLPPDPRPPLWQDDFPASPPPDLPIRPVSLPKTESRTLPNGLKIVVAETHRVPLVTLR